MSDSSLGRLVWYAIVGLIVWFAVHTSELQPPSSDPLVARPATPVISVPIPDVPDYATVVGHIDRFAGEAPGLAERGNYGKSRRGHILQYLRLTNLHARVTKRSVLLTAAIHGNEPWSTSTLLSCVARLLTSYGKDANATALLDGLDVYVVPVVCPDSFPSSRHIDGVDPNRDFPGPHNPSHQSTPCVKALQDFFLAHHFNAAWSGHTFGRVFLYPYGRSNDPCPDDAAFKKLFGGMASKAQYEAKPACRLYSYTIDGSEVDWYYDNGATACVCEYGTHQRLPSPEDSRSEMERTWPALLQFLQEAPGLRAGNRLSRLLRGWYFRSELPGRFD